VCKYLGFLFAAMMVSGSSGMIMRSGARFASQASPWGSATWRHDRTAFLQFCKSASVDTPSAAKREWNGFLSLAFADVDADKDGKINAAEFDILCESVARLPRRFGLAPTWEVEYGGDKAKRLAARQAMFDQIDGLHGPRRGWIGMAMFIEWATAHVSSKVAGSVVSGVDFYHIGDYSKEEFIKAIETAVQDRSSADYANFYEFLLTIFAEEDYDCKGVVTREGFGRVIDRAAFVPRHFGLAPPSADAARLDELYAQMEDKRMGGVTFRKLLAWTLEHTKGKTEALKK